MGLVALWTAGRAAFLWAEWRAAVPAFPTVVAVIAKPDPVAAVERNAIGVTPASVTGSTVVPRIAAATVDKPLLFGARPRGVVVEPHSPGIAPARAGAASFLVAPLNSVPEPPAAAALAGATGMNLRTPTQRILNHDSSALRLGGSLWAIGRGGGAGPANGTTLAGAQTGTRLYLGRPSGLAATARLSAALGQAGREAAVGLAWRRGGAVLIAERRIAIDRGGRDAFSFTIAGGKTISLGAGRSVDGYAQTGIVGRDGFADGAVRIEQSAAPGIAVGLGAWGAAQPNLARLDVGPLVALRTRIANRPVRIAAEWRTRIAGNASPASGPTLSLGADF